MNIFRMLIFFPSITFSLLSAEVFPWAVFYSATKRIRLYKRLLPLILLICASLLHTGYVVLSTDCTSDVLRSLIAYANPILVYLSILCCSKKEILILSRTIGKILFLLIIIGILQTFGVVDFLRPVFSFLTPRASTDILELGGRGVTLLSSEPSRASYEILFIYLAWRYLQQMSVEKQLFFDFMIAFFILFVIRSSMGFIVLIVFLLSEYRLKFMLTGIIMIIVVLPALTMNNRAIGMIISILSNASIRETFTYLLSASGFRLISIIAAYKYGFSHPFGGGIGLWQTSSVDALYQTDINPSSLAYFRNNNDGFFAPVRPTSYLSAMTLDMGFAVIPIIFYLIKPIFKFLSPKSKLFSLTTTFLFFLTIIGATGNPIPWICMALCYRIHHIGLTSGA